MMKYDMGMLKTVPLFSGMEERELFSMLECLNVRVTAYEKGTMIFSEGDPADTMGVVLQGGVQVIRDDIYGNRSIVAAVEEGELFAEAFCCADVERLPVGVYAHRDVTVMLMDIRRVLRTCSSSCSFHQRLISNLLRNVARKNLLLNQKIEFTSKKTTKEKLMAYLLAQAKRAGSRRFTIPYDRQSLADYLGVDRSAMSAEIGKLRDQGYLEVDRRQFRILREFEV